MISKNISLVHMCTHVRVHSEMSFGYQKEIMATFHIFPDPTLPNSGMDCHGAVTHVVLLSTSFSPRKYLTSGLR